MPKISKVLVTGGAGFIGSHLANKLTEKGYSVTVLDNFHFGKTENLRATSGYNSLDTIAGDVRDKRVARRAISDVDAVVHLAALIDVERSVTNPRETHDVNATGTLNILEEAVKKSVRRFVFASSTAVYGETGQLPLKENSPLGPMSPYAASKASAEYYCRAFHNCYRLGTVVLRYFNVYGAEQNHSAYCGVITKLLHSALSGEPLIVFGDGEQTRDFIHVEDVVRATILALENDDANGETLNVCTGTPTTVNRLIKTLKETSGKDLRVTHDKPRIGDVRDNYGDPTKAEQVLGFKAKTDLKEGLEQLLRDAQSHVS